MGCRPCCKPHSNINNTFEFNTSRDIPQNQSKEFGTFDNPINVINSGLLPKEEIFLKSNKNNFKYYFEILEIINTYRKRHNVDPLNLNNDINLLSQKHSDKIARENYIELSYNKYNNTELGEIIFCFKENNSPENIISSFYEKECHKYNFKNKNPKPSNFTQIIWKNSKYVGIGCSKTRENIIYTVINFYPPGNIKNEFLENVLPPKEERKSNYSSNKSDHKINFLEELFNRNNEYREKHGVPLLILNPSLTTKANEFANLMAENDFMMDEEIEYFGENCGKNIFISKNNNYDGKKICDEWYEEIKEYNFINMKKNDKEKVKNFTQLIWKNSEQVGFGWANNNKGICYVVGIYYPCGNVEGKYQENVLPEIE